MIKFLYSILFWVPVLGGILRGLYVAQLVTSIKAKANNWTPPDGLANDRENLDDEIKAEAEKFMDLTLDEMSIDSVLGLIVKRAALNSVVAAFRRAIVG